MNSKKIDPLRLGIGLFAGSASLFVYLFPYQATAEWFYVGGFFVGVVGIAPLGLLLAYWRMASLLPQTEIDPLLLGIGWFAGSAFLFVCLFPYQATADWFRTAGFFMGGVGVAPLGLLLAHRRTVSLSAQTKNEIARRVTDSLTKAVELLGHEEIAVRQGGIHALGRIAAENCEEHPKIMNIIAAYIRHRSRAYVHDEYAKEKNTKLEAKKQFGMRISPFGPPTWDEFIKNHISQCPSPIDLEAAVAVVRDRNAAFDILPVNGASFLDLSGAFLFQINFGGALLKRVDFRGSILHNCMFRNAKLNHAIMREVNFTRSRFSGADMSGVQGYRAIFKSVNMVGAMMCGALLNRTNFESALLGRANFTGAQLRHANFSNARLSHGIFTCANFEGACFDNADLRGADLSEVESLTAEQIESAKGDDTTKLPEGMKRPAHWPNDSEE